MMASRKPEANNQQALGANSPRGLTDKLVDIVASRVNENLMTVANRVVPGLLDTTGHQARQVWCSSG